MNWGTEKFIHHLINYNTLAVLRIGEIIIVRITRFNINPDKFDALMAWSDSISDQINSPTVLASGYMTRASENEIVSLGIYEDEKSLENAQEAVKELMSQMSEFLTSTLETITAEAIRSFKS